MKLGSLFDGSGGFPLAGCLCGIEPAWASEVEPYPIAVTRSRFPNMKHLGDISKINGAEVEPVDIITFGSPCQDLSVAGKRAGLKHEANGDDETTRSGLFMEAVRIIREMKEATHGRFPSYALWENVPGAFSSNGGEDFRIVLEELIKIVEPTAVMPAVPKNGWPYADSYCGDGWSLAYRVFDAQYWGVPQRRRRIHLVLDLRGERAREVLFEREGVRGYFAEGRTPWQATASHAEDCAGADDRAGDGCVAYSFDSLASNSMKSSNPHSGCRQVKVAKTLDTTDPNPSKNQGGIAVLEPVPYTLKIRSGCEGGGKGALIQTDKSATLATNNDQYLFQPIAFAQNQRDEVRDLGNKSGAIMAEPGMKQQTFIAIPAPVTLEPGIAAREGGHIYEGVSGTLRAEAGDNRMAVAHMVLDDQGGSSINVRTDGKSPTLRAEMHGNVPCVMESAGFCPEQSAKTRGIGYEEEMAPTLRAGVTPGVAYSIENHPADSRVSIDESGKVQTLTSRMGTGGGNVPMVMEPKPVYCLQGNSIDRADTAGCNGKGWKEDICYTLNTIDRPAVAHLASGKETVGTLMANAGTKLWLGNQEAFSGDYHIIEERETPTIRYIVRRLTPTECARLQGFADRWGDIDPKTEFSDAEYSFWMEVRNTHATVIGGREAKEYTKEQMLKWYNGLQTDSSEYKMWGNGIALPPALYVLQGITDALQRLPKRALVKKVVRAE